MNIITVMSMGCTRNLKLGATWRQGPGHRGQWKSACGPMGQMSTRVGIAGGLGVMSTYDHFRAKIGFKFRSLGKRHLNVLEASIIIICTLLSSHLDKCIVTVRHFSTTNISPGGNYEGKGKGIGGSCPPPLPSPSSAAHEHCVCRLQLQQY